MYSQFFSIGLIVLLGAMLPGPDFAIVTKNSLLHSRRAGLFTALGIGFAILIHMSYCVFGLALAIAKSYFLFNLIKYIGASYLIYLGISALRSQPSHRVTTFKNDHQANSFYLTSFRQGFFCNLFNPKATLFFLSLFTVVIKPNTPLNWQIMYALEIPLIAITWFSLLTLILSNAVIKRILEKAECYIAKLLGIFLIGFGLILIFI